MCKTFTVAELPSGFEFPRKSNTLLLPRLLVSDAVALDATLGSDELAKVMWHVSRRRACAAARREF